MGTEPTRQKRPIFPVIGTSFPDNGMKFPCSCKTPLANNSEQNRALVRFRPGFSSYFGGFSLYFSGFLKDWFGQDWLHHHSLLMRAPHFKSSRKRGAE